MNFEMILKAAKYLEYREEVEARGETPCSFSDFDRIVAFPHEDEQSKEGLQPSTDSHGANGINPDSAAMPDLKKNVVNGKSVDINKKNSNSGLITREAHNRLEKNRRAQMKECFENVKLLLPSIANQKVSNVVVLKSLRREVNSIKKLHEKLTIDKRFLKHKNDCLRGRLLQLKRDVPNHEIWMKYNMEVGNDGESTTTASEVGSADETGELCFSSLPGDESTRSCDETEKSHMMNASRPSVLINPKGEKWNLQTGTFDGHCERGSPILFASLTAASVGNNVPKTNTSISSLLVQSTQNSNQLSGTSSSIQLHHSASTGSLENTSRHVCIKSKEFKTTEVDQRCDEEIRSFDSTSNMLCALQIAADSLDDIPGTLADTSQSSLAVNIQNKVLDPNISLQTSASSGKGLNMANLASVCRSELSLLKKSPVNISLPSLPPSFPVSNKTVVQHAHKVISKNSISDKVFVALSANNMLLKTEKKAMSSVSYNGNRYISAGVPHAKEPSQSGSKKVLLISTSSMVQNKEHSSSLANHAASLLALSSPKSLIKQNSPQLPRGCFPGGLPKEVVAFNTLPEENIEREKRFLGKDSLYKDLKCVPTAMVLEPTNSMCVTSSVLNEDSTLGTNLQYNQLSKFPSSLHQSDASLPVNSVSIHHNYSVVSSSKKQNPNFHRTSEKKSISCPPTVLVKQGSIQDNVIVQLSQTVPQIELLLPSSKHSTCCVSLDPEIKTGMLYSTPPHNSSIHSVLKLSPPSKPQDSHSKDFASKDNLLENMSEIVTPQLFLVSVPSNRPNELSSTDVNARDSDL